MNSPSSIWSETSFTAMISPNAFVTRSKHDLGHLRLLPRASVSAKPLLGQAGTRMVVPLSGSPQQIQPQQRRPHHGGRRQPDHARRRGDGMQPSVDPAEERAPTVAEDAATEHDVRRRAAASAAAGSPCPAIGTSSSAWRSTSDERRPDRRRRPRGRPAARARPTGPHRRCRSTWPPSPAEDAASRSAAGADGRSDVRCPRPSSSRIACQSASRPMSPPPPQSPEIGPTAGAGRSRPSGDTPQQLVPKPQTIPTPQSRFVPARRTANVSLRKTLSPAQPRPRRPRADAPVVQRQVGSGEAEHTDVGDRGPAVRWSPRRGTRHAPRRRSRSRKASSPVAPYGAAATRAAPRTVPSRREQRRVDLRAAAVDREHGGRVSRLRLQPVDRHEPRALHRAFRR